MSFPAVSVIEGSPRNSSRSAAQKLGAPHLPPGRRNFLALRDGGAVRKARPMRQPLSPRREPPLYFSLWLPHSVVAPN